MKIVPARQEHLDAIDAITHQAKASLAAMGVDQWQQGYPNRTVWQNDIAHGDAYVVLDDEMVVGAFRYGGKPERVYETLEGTWLSTSDAYATVHRSAVAAHARGRGIMGMMFAFACQKALDDGLASVRVDTHENNLPMRRAIEKAGFTRCGTVRLVDGLEAGSQRVAYERLVEGAQS